MANMQPEQSGTSSAPKAGVGGTAETGKAANAAKVEKKAEDVRKKGHDLADSARSGVDTVRDTIDSANDYAKKAQDFIGMAEKRLDQLIDQAEKLFAKGTKYTGTVKSYLNNNPQYKERLQSAVSKYHEFSDKLRQKAQGQAGGNGPSMAEKGKEKMETVTEKGREQARSALRSSSQYIRENPAEAVLVGAAVGVLLGTAYRHMRTEEIPATSYYESKGGSPYGAI